MHGNHLKHMLVGGGVLLGVLVLLGVPLGTALPYAALLACPLMMIVMMGSMGGHDGHGHDRSADVGQQSPPETAPDGTPGVSRR